jgi:hypothetical protein
VIATTPTVPARLELCKDAFYLIDSAVFLGIKYHRTAKVKTEDFLFFFFQNIGRFNTANMVNTSSSPLSLFGIIVSRPCLLFGLGIDFLQV